MSGMTGARRIPPFSLAAAGVALCLVAACAGAAARRAPEPAPDRQRELLDLGDDGNEFSCRAVRGALVVLVRPETGAVVLALAEFPGAEPVGAIEGANARFSIPGLKMREQSIASRTVYAHPVTLWGMAVADAEGGAWAGCFALERPAGADAEDLKALVRRRAREKEPSPSP